MIQHAIFPISDLKAKLKTSKYFREETRSYRQLNRLIDDLRDDLWCYFEEPYVDRVYRDSYYSYYASKLDDFSRDCGRISFFTGKIEKTNFTSEDEHKVLKETYVGFAVLRPINSGNPGRSVLSPIAFKRHNFICELTPIRANIGGVKLHAHCFPYSSQDSESMTCAETAIWSLMEYYGNRYPEQRPVLPSEIHHAFERPTRVLPSEGLTIVEIATALSRFGFGTHLYSTKTKSSLFSTVFFQRALYCYVESGIPVILGLEGDNNGPGHAIVAIGHEILTEEETRKRINALPGEKDDSGEFDYVDSADLGRRFVQIDDNYPPYQMSGFENPCEYYNASEVKNLKIKHFTVPLNRRVYLEAGKTAHLVDSLLKSSKTGWHAHSKSKPTRIVRRIFLTSGDSYKAYVATSNMAGKLKEILLAMELPRFVWIAELSSTQLYYKNEVCGFILLDATGNENFDAAKMILYPGYLKAAVLGDVVVDFDFGTFKAYQNNLKGDWCEWKG